MDKLRKLVREQVLHDYDKADSTGSIAQSSATARTLPAPRAGAWQEDPTSDKQALSSEKTVASNLIALLRAIDDDDNSTGEGPTFNSPSHSPEARKQALSNHIMMHMRDDRDFEERKQPCIHRAKTCDPMLDSDFTVRTRQATSTTGLSADTALDPANLHVVIQHEVTPMQRAVQAVQFEAPSDAPQCSLNVPYRSLNTSMMVKEER